VAWLAITALSAVVPTASTHAQQITTGFRSDASRYVWTGGVELDESIGTWRLAASNEFRSEAFLLVDRVTEWRDENITRFLLERPLTDRYAAVAHGRGTWFSQNAASTQEAYVGINAHPSALWSIEPALGLVVDRKPGLLLDGQTKPDVLLDGGLGISMRGSFQDAKVGQFVLQGRTDNRWHFIQPRFGRSVLSEVAAVRTLDRGSVTIDARYANQRRDAYQASSFLNRGSTSTRSDGTIEGTTSDTLDAGVLIEHPLWRNWNVRTDTRLTVNNRYVRTRRAPEGELFFDTNFNRTVLDLQGRITYDTDRTNAGFTATRSITGERRRLDNAETLPPAQATQRTATLRQADFDRGLFTLQGTYSTAVSGWLSVRSSLRGSILRHDTPETNVDDRDESTVDGDIGLRVRLRSDLNVDLRLFGVQYHTVFLNGERSGESNRRRSLRFRPGMRWRPSSSTSVTLETEVRAVYTTDDFDLPNQPKNDQSARELKYIGSIRQDIATDASLNLEASFSELLLGRLLWEDFKEIPFDTLKTTTGSFSIRVGSRLVGEAGIRALYRSDFERSLTLRYIVIDENGQRSETITRPGRERLLQFGPTTEISFPMTNRSELRLAGWIQFQQIRYTLYGEIPDEDGAAIRRAAERIERRTIPNLMMTLVWNL